MVAYDLATDKRYETQPFNAHVVGEGAHVLRNHFHCKRSFQLGDGNEFEFNKILRYAFLFRHSHISLLFINLADLNVSQWLLSAEFGSFSPENSQHKEIHVSRGSWAAIIW